MEDTTVVNETQSTVPRCPECATAWSHYESIPLEGWEEFSGWYCTSCDFFLLD